MFLVLFFLHRFDLSKWHFCLPLHGFLVWLLYLNRLTFLVRLSRIKHFYVKKIIVSFKLVTASMLFKTCCCTYIHYIVLYLFHAFYTLSFQIFACALPTAEPLLCPIVGPGLYGDLRFHNGCHLGPRSSNSAETPQVSNTCSLPSDSKILCNKSLLK